MTREQAITKLIEACRGLREMYKDKSSVRVGASSAVWNVVKALADVDTALPPQESEREKLRLIIQDMRANQNCARQASLAAALVLPWCRGESLQDDAPHREDA